MVKSAQASEQIKFKSTFFWWLLNISIKLALLLNKNDQI